MRDDTYTIVATRYGKEIGGTEGNYVLTISGASTDFATETLNLNLPDGDIEVTLVWNNNADLQLLVRDPIGDAVYDDAPFINSGGILQEDGNVSCIFDDTSGPLILHILAPTASNVPAHTKSRSGIKTLVTTPHLSTSP